MFIVREFFITCVDSTYVNIIIISDNTLRKACEARQLLVDTTEVTMTICCRRKMLTWQRACMRTKARPRQGFSDLLYFSIIDHIAKKTVKINTISLRKLEQDGPNFDARLSSRYMQ